MERGGDVLVAVPSLSRGDEDIAAPEAFPQEISVGMLTSGKEDGSGD
jgi:hypothetical protein